ncbi:hypothetical protein R1flu_003617 [Riccia fluitans]|uniref:DUF7642 domain-containing protein n=1 Tax=Riccia fluitans TaxID=41844 RepID=A0ABD1Y9I1_9MARC
MALDEIPKGDPVSHTDDEEAADLGRILYIASFTEMENNYVNYDTAQWILISLPLILIYGVGLIMLLYTPIRRYAVRQDIRSRKLYVTSNAIVYKVSRPLCCPCFGVSKLEKHVMLNLVTDVLMELGCLQSCYGISSVRIGGSSGQNQPKPGDDVWIQGIANPRLFKKLAVLTALSNIRKQGADDPAKASGSEESQLRLEEIEASVKRVELMLSSKHQKPDDYPKSNVDMGEVV